MPAFKDKVKGHEPKQEEPLWKGPEEDGITQSMLSQFLVCRERFRVRYVLGLQPVDDFNHRIEYGSMWHAAEEGLAGDGDWETKLRGYVLGLCHRYPMRQEQIIHWYEVCKVQFPIYVAYWAQHEDVVGRTPLLQEVSFNVPYKLSSGRTVKLRGKWDSVDLVGRGKKAGVWLQENKTKGDIDVALLQRQLLFDLQTMLYLVALGENNDLSAQLYQEFRGSHIAGVRYNVVRRPLSGGRCSIRQGKNETSEAFYQRLETTIKEAVGSDYGMPDGENYFFMRWKVEVTPDDIKRFKERFLNPILEQVCDWWEGQRENSDPFAPYMKGSYGDTVDTYYHYQMPYGVYSPLLDGGITDVDEYLVSGSTAGLQRADRLFKELD